jgi:alpha-beta hydrolase superfamily lysophospholipase
VSTADDLGARELPEAAPSTPAWIGDGLFGWFTRAAPGSPPRRSAVLLCNPFGYEAMCTHRTYRKLVARLSQAGFPSLRFDWPGTGDSAGDDCGGNLERWQGALRDAAVALRSRARASAVVLFGLRLGGTVALVDGGAIEGVEAAVAWAPHRTGKDLWREVRAFRLLKGQPPPSVGGEGAEEAAGYLLTSDDLRTLAATDVTRATPAPGRVLLLSRDDIPQDGGIAMALRRRGAAVTARPLAGYAAMMRDAFESVVPYEAIDETVAWLADVDPLLRPHASPAADRPAAAAHGERLLQFGPAARLFGILTPAARPSKRPAVLIPNTGSNHHVGPNRLGVRLARMLAAEGFSSLRFDVSGIGDSRSDEAGAENRMYSQQSTEDVRSAISEALRQTSAPGVALFGICSGAYAAFQVLDDPRVAAQVLVNLQTFRWKEGDSLEFALRQSARSTAFYRSALLDPRTWKRFLSGRVDIAYVGAAMARRVGRRLTQHGSALRSLLRNGRYEHSDVARRFHRFADRRGVTLMVYSSGDGGLDVMAEHLGAGARKLLRRPGFSLRLVEGADHTFTQVGLQPLLLDIVTSHLCATFAEAP